MPRLTLRTKRVRFSAEVPASVARRLHHLRNQARRATHASSTTDAGSLMIAKRTPELRVVRRNALEAVQFYRGLTGPGNGDVTERADLPSLVPSIFWYHTIELPGGLVTPGLYDHRPLVPRYGLPEKLDGLRALDVATFDGFWAFELERRGADVVAADINRFSSCDLPPPVREVLLREQLDRDTGVGFALVHDALRSKVRRIERSIYDLSAEDLGTFDFVHVADLLLHLERPLAALRAVRAVTHGQALITDCFDPELEPGAVRYLGAWSNVPWWLPSLDTLAQMVLDAGFADVELRLVYALAPRGEERGHWRASLLATT